MYHLNKTFLASKDPRGPGGYLTFVRHSKRQKQRKVETRTTNIHLRTLIQSKNPTPSERALHYFNIYHKKFLGNAWHSTRLALLSSPKHVSLLNNFANPAESNHKLSLMGCSNIFPTNSEQKSSSKQEDEEEPIWASHKAEDHEVDQIEGRGRTSLGSMDSDEASNRLISPHQRISRRGESFESMYEFVPVSKLKGLEDFVEEGESYDSYDKISSTEAKDFPITLWKESRLIAPPALKALSFPRGNVSRFPAPKPDHQGHYDYYCLDGASILPVLALGLEKGVSVLDLCSGPGGKALAMAQTSLPARLVLNDTSRSRLKRVRNVFHQYFGEGLVPYEGLKLDFSLSDGEDYFMNKEGVGEGFDRVLVDVPCLTDRVVLREDDNNIFHPRRNKERLRLPELQISLLKSALLCVKPGGIVVYSTCTISPLQNDGVIHRALKELWEDGQMEFAISDLSDAVSPLKESFNFAEGMRYGQLVLPRITNNFGPMYFAKIKRLIRQ